MDNIVNNVPHIKRKGGISPAVSLVKAAICLLFFHRDALLIKNRFKLVANLTHVDGSAKLVHLYDDGLLNHNLAIIVLVNAFSARDSCAVYAVVNKNAINNIVRGQSFNDLSLAVFVIQADEEAVFGSHGLPFVRCRLHDN